MTESVLDGTSQFALSTLLLAVVAYIRTVPYKQLAEKRETPKRRPERKMATVNVLTHWLS